MIISIFIGASNCSEAYFLQKKIGFAKEQNFKPKTAISAINLNLNVTTCVY